MGDEPGHVERVPVQSLVIGLLDHVEDLRENPGHLIRARQVSGIEGRIDQVQCQRYGLFWGQLHIEALVQRGNDSFPPGQFAWVKVGDLGPQRVVDLDGLPGALDGEADVIGHREHGGRRWFLATFRPHRGQHLVGDL